MESAFVRHAVIAGQQIGIQTHVSRAARVGVIAETDELSAGNAGTEISLELKYLAPRISDPKIITRFCSPRSLSRAQSMRRDSLPWQVMLRQPSHRRRETLRVSFSARRISVKTSGLAAEFDGLRIDDVQPCPMQPDAIANLPGEQGMLLRRSLPISRIAGALYTSRMLAVDSALGASAARQGSEVSGAMVVNIVRLQQRRGQTFCSR